MAIVLVRCDEERIMITKLELQQRNKLIINNLNKKVVVRVLKRKEKCSFHSFAFFHRNKIYKAQSEDIKYGCK